MTFATAMPPAQSLGANSVILIGINSADFQDRKLSRDKRLRFMSVETALRLLWQVSNAEVVIRPYKGLEPHRREKLEHIIRNLRRPDGGQVLSILLNDEGEAESRLLALFGKADDQVVPAESPEPFTPSLLEEEESVVEVESPPPAPVMVQASKKAELGRRYYAEVSGSAEKLLKILHENGYPDATIVTARTLLSNTKIALRKKDELESSARKPPTSVPKEDVEALRTRVEAVREELQAIAEGLKKIAENHSRVA